MDQKFDRRYKLRVEVAPQSVPASDALLGTQTATIELPYTCEFTVERMTLATNQTATIRIINLRQATRDLLYKDPFWSLENRFVEFYAGYRDFMPLIFYGKLVQCVSWREGVNNVTEIQATSMVFDAKNANIQKTFAASPEVTAPYILRELNRAMPGVNPKPVIGKIGPLDKSGNPVPIPKAVSFDGPVWPYIQQVSNGRAVLDNNTMLALGDNEVVSVGIPLINSASGIIGTPKRGQNGVEVSLIFEPRFTLQQVVQLKSEFNDNLSGTYKVQGFRHSGTISPRVGGNYQTDALFWRPGLRYDPDVIQPSDPIP